MALAKNIFWWLCFIALAICVQSLAPGLDVLVVGIIVLMHEGDWKDLLWLLPLFALLQEGMGTRPFGAAIVWYAATVGIFLIGRWFFEVGNFIFMFLLSAALGCAYYGVCWLMAPLQDLTFNVADTLDKSLVQAIFMPFAWRAIVALRKPVPKEE